MSNLHEMDAHLLAVTPLFTLVPCLAVGLGGCPSLSPRPMRRTGSKGTWQELRNSHHLLLIQVHVLSIPLLPAGFALHKYPCVLSSGGT